MMALNKRGKLRGMKHKPLIVFPVEAPVHYNPFDLYAALEESLAASGESLQDGDVLAVSSKYTAISEGRVVALSAINVTPEAQAIAARYGMNAHMVQLVLQEADHVFGGITGFLLTYKDGIVSPNAGIDRSNIPNGYAVLFPKEPYRSAEALRLEVRRRFNVEIGVILTDSWLMPGRRGTAGVALATAGFKPLQDERGKDDLFGNPMQVTLRGTADTICSAAQLVMGERDEATPFAIVRNAGVELTDEQLSEADVAIPWEQCIYVQSLTSGLLEKAPSTGAQIG